jgi:hypothetical protein
MPLQGVSRNPPLTINIVFMFCRDSRRSDWFWRMDMAVAAGIVAEMTKAFEIANVEMFAISLPEAKVIAATSAVMRKWNCTREELVGKQLVKFGTGPLSARQTTEESPYGPQQKVGHLRATSGTTCSIRFTPQNQRWRPERDDVGWPACKPEEAEDAIRTNGASAWRCVPADMRRGTMTTQQ